MDKETEERVNKPIPFAEFPKMLYHPDGRQLIAADAGAEKDAFNGDFVPTPEAALKVKDDRDTAQATRERQRIGAEAKAAGKSPQ